VPPAGAVQVRVVPIEASNGMLVQEDELVHGEKGPPAFTHTPVLPNAVEHAQPIPQVVDVVQNVLPVPGRHFLLRSQS
jgi:hypothetical protein